MKPVAFKAFRTQGFSLIELLLVLGVLAILLLAAFVVYPQVRDRNQANTEIANLALIKASINNLYASKGGKYTSSLNTRVANQARAFPSSMNGGDYSTGAIRSQWGGPVYIGDFVDPTTDIGDAPIQWFGIGYENVPKGICVHLVTGAAGHFDQIFIDYTPVFTNAGGSPAFAGNGGQLDPGRAAQLCEESDGYVVFSSR